MSLVWGVSSQCEVAHIKLDFLSDVFRVSQVGKPSATSQHLELTGLCLGVAALQSGPDREDTPFQYQSTPGEVKPSTATATSWAPGPCLSPGEPRGHSLEVVASRLQEGLGLIGHRPHDHSWVILVSAYQFLHHL